MKVREIYEAMGGRAYVMVVTGLQPPPLARFATKNRIPTYWIRFFIALRPELDWDYLLDVDSRKFAGVLENTLIRDLRAQRMRQSKKPRAPEYAT